MKHVCIMSEIETAREKFFAFLLRKTCTEKQALEFLEKLRISDDEISALMREAQEIGLVDDDAYALLFAQGHDSWGDAKIKFELSRRGINSESVNYALENITPELERAREIFDSLRKSCEDRKIRSRLISRGFSSRVINRILRNVSEIDY